MPETDLRSVEDLFLVRRVQFAFHRKRLEFDLARTVFASANIDPGSALLLRYLQTLDLEEVHRVLDVGCGQGTLGIVLKALAPARHVTFVDRDALAMRYTARNLALNGLDGTAGAAVKGSLGYDSLGSDDVGPGLGYDLIVSNIPGKAGPAVIDELVSGACAVAAPGAIAGFVVVNPLAEAVRELVAGRRFEPLLDKGNKTHTVILGRVAITGEVAVEGAFDRGVYDRLTGAFYNKDLTWRARTVVGLDEFDTLAQPTRLLRQALQGVRAAPSMVINPGQGHRAVIAALAGYPPAVLASRDLLALEASARCLGDAGFAEGLRLEHGITYDLPWLDESGWERPPITILHNDDKVHGPWLTAEVTRYLDSVAAFEWPDRAQRPELVLSGRSGILGRLEVDLLARRPGHVAYKKSVKGHRVLRFESKLPKR